MKKRAPVSLLTILCLSYTIKAQTSSTDSLRNKKDVDNKSINVLIDGGYQKKFFYEIGIGKGRLQGALGNIANFGYYGSYERAVGTTHFDPVNGVK